MYLMPAFIMVILLVAACGGDDATSTSRAPSATEAAPTNTLLPASPTASPTTPAVSQGTDIQVDIVNFAHQDLVIQIGAMVTWTQQDGGTSHTTTSESVDEENSWDSDFLRQGESFTHTFKEAGVFLYFCRVHPATMQGTVTVVDNITSQSALPSAATAEPVKELRTDDMDVY